MLVHRSETLGLISATQAGAKVCGPGCSLLLKCWEREREKYIHSSFVFMFMEMALWYSRLNNQMVLMYSELPGAFCLCRFSMTTSEVQYQLLKLFHLFLLARGFLSLNSPFIIFIAVTLVLVTFSLHYKLGFSLASVKTPLLIFPFPTPQAYFLSFLPFLVDPIP